MNKALSNGIIVCVIVLLVFWAVDIDWISPFISTPVVSDHKGIFPVAGIPILSNPPFIPQFPRYLDANSSLIPSWILSSPNENTIHRFFDTSPFSPSGRFVGVTQMRVKENRQVHVCDVAEILIYDLYTGVTRHISETTAWDSQVGSHVQWGLDDTELYFNSLPSHKEDSSDKPRGVVFNIFTNQSRTFDCPIYQISPNGLYSASPDLTSIRYTQLGYGIFTHGSHPSHNASKSNGLFLTDLSTGSCRLLVSLYDIAIFGDLPLDEPIYGFHVKWSSDNRMIMFVVRTLTSSVETSTGAKRAIKTARVNHLFTIDAVSGKILCHVVSWGSGCGSLNTQQYRTSAVSPTPSTSAPDSAPVSGGTLLLSEYQPSQSRVTSHIGGIAVRGDGNHPNWIPDSHKISLNYLSVCDYPEGRDKGQGQGQGIPVWKIAVFDVDEILSAEKSLGRRDGPKDTAPIERGQIAYGYGTGHPNYFPGGRFFVTDAYLKEKRMVGQGSIPPQQIRTDPNSKPQRKDKEQQDGEVMLPLRLVDTVTQEEVWLLEANLKRYVVPSSESAVHKAYLQSKSVARWRCDMHPAFNRNFSWVAFNARPGGQLRQVMVAFLGDQGPQRFFKRLVQENRNSRQQRRGEAEKGRIA